MPWVSPELQAAALEVIEQTDNAGALHGLALRLSTAGADELQAIAAGLEKYGARKEAAIARADARMNQIPVEVAE